MSYNTNNPNQQWQPLVDPNNQQHLQPVNQQAIPSSPAPGGGNYQQSQQSYTWTDGNTQGQHQSLQQSWSWQGQTSPPAIQSPPAFSQPSMLMQGTSHHQLHQQMHQNAMNHSQQALAIHQQAMNMHQSIALSLSNMTPTMQQTPQPQIAYQSVSPQPQRVYQQSMVQSPLSQQPQIAHQSMGSPLQSPALITPQQQYSQQQQTYGGSPLTSPMAVQPRLQSPQSIYQQIMSPRSPHPHTQASQQTPLARQNLQSPHDGNPPQSQQSIEHHAHDRRFSELERQRTHDIENMNRAGAEINKRLRDLELNKTSVQSNHEAKDQEVRRLQEQLAAVERQRRLDAERNSQQLAELVRSQATSPSAQTPAFDMSALQKVIRETQTQQLSVQDIERVIEEQVSKRLAGMATKADIQNAGAQMQTALSQVPAGLNEEQVQQAVNRELNSVMQDVANRVNQQRRIAGQGQQDPRIWQTPRDHVQTEFVVEELPDEVTVMHPHGATKEAKSQSALPPAGNQDPGSRFTPGAGQYGTAYPTSAYNEVQSTSQGALTTGQYASGSQYTAIEGGQPQTSVEVPQQPHVPVSSIPDTHRHAAIEAPPVAPNIPGTVASANSFLPTGAGNAAMPYASSAQQYGAAPGQLQLATAQSAPAHEWAASPSNLVGAAGPQGQLEAPAVQMQHIAGVAPQLQLEAPSSSLTGHSIAGQELVHQSRDLEKQTQRR